MDPITQTIKKDIRDILYRVNDGWRYRVKRPMKDIIINKKFTRNWSHDEIKEFLNQDQSLFKDTDSTNYIIFLLKSKNIFHKYLPSERIILYRDNKICNLDKLSDREGKFYRLYILGQCLGDERMDARYKMFNDDKYY